MHLVENQMEHLCHANRGARVRLLRCAVGRARCGAGRDLRESLFVDCVRKDQRGGISYFGFL